MVVSPLRGLFREEVTRRKVRQQLFPRYGGYSKKCKSKKLLLQLFPRYGGYSYGD